MAQTVSLKGHVLGHEPLFFVLGEVFFVALNTFKSVMHQSQNPTFLPFFSDIVS